MYLPPMLLPSWIFKEPYFNADFFFNLHDSLFKNMFMEFMKSMEFMETIHKNGT